MNTENLNEILHYFTNRKKEFVDKKEFEKAAKMRDFERVLQESKLVKSEMRLPFIIQDGFDTFEVNENALLVLKCSQALYYNYAVFWKNESKNRIEELRFNYLPIIGSFQIWCKSMLDIESNELEVFKKNIFDNYFGAQSLIYTEIIYANRTLRQAVANKIVQTLNEIYSHHCQTFTIKKNLRIDKNQLLLYTLETKLNCQFVLEKYIENGINKGFWKVVMSE